MTTPCAVLDAPPSASDTMKRTVWYIDHDGTLSTGDIGQDYLCQCLGMNKEEFVNAVYAMRDRSERDPEYHPRTIERLRRDADMGLELATMLVEYGVNQSDVEEAGNDAHNSLRPGVLEFISQNQDEKHILSAGPGDWLRPFWSKYPGTNLYVRGTELYTGPDGRYTGISRPCGRKGKPKVIHDDGNDDALLIAVGDSQGDGLMFEYVRQRHGLTIGVGPNIKGDINVPGYSWNPIWAAGEVFSEIRGTRKAEVPPYDPDEIEPNTLQGEQILAYLKTGSVFIS